MPNIEAEKPYIDPLEHTPLHTLLVNTNRLQAVPDTIVLLIIAVNAVLTGVVWLSAQLPGAWLVIVGYVAAMAGNWGLLRALPRTGRSFGPDKPSVMALAIVSALLLCILGISALPWWLGILLLLVITGIVYYSTWVEPFRLDVTHQTYITGKWRSQAPPLRLLQVGDIHVERVTPRERHLNRLIDELKPDMIVFTGDFVNLSNTHDPEAEKAIREIISQWRAPLGVYCVTGTPLVEPLERVESFVRGLDNLKLLPNQWISIQTPGGDLNILGLVVTHDMTRDRELLKKMMLSAPTNGMHLLLMHPPDIAPEANDAGIDLYLCGHTHGGQIRMPIIGPIFSSSHLGNQFIMGRYELGTTTLYTARGVGLEGLGAPRARFLCPPEIVLWEIRGKT
ncbi:MAG: metallophosphoesterase [Anaerolineae bacterium]|nr:metallophosphoesterase [Anaerolineae bacterium]